MPLGSGAPEVVGVALRDGVPVPVPVTEGVAGGVGGAVGGLEAEGSREDVTVTGGVLETVAVPVRVLLGELEGVWESVREDDAAAKPELNGGITTPR